jgi:hypothetical protein
MMAHVLRHASLLLGNLIFLLYSRESISELHPWCSIQWNDTDVIRKQVLPSRKEKKAVIETFNQLLAWGEAQVSEANRAKLRMSQHHAPVYHEWSVLLHVQRVIEAAEALRLETGVDARYTAIYHDAGKFVMFDKTLLTCDFFAGHEAISAALAQAHGVNTAAVFAIANHDAAYSPRVGFDARVFAALADGDEDKLRQLVGLCACDAAGKGNTPAQREQRPKIACLLQDVARDSLRDERLAEAVWRLAAGR